MSAAAALKAARALGVDVTLDGNDLLVEAVSDPPAATIEDLSRHKAEIIELLRPKKDGWSAEDWRLPMECDQCGKSTGTVQQAWICDPGGQPITARLHRECEAAFLQQAGSQHRAWNGGCYRTSSCNLVGVSRLGG